MFGSNLLDVALGMIFVYLLLSLVCSAANEVIEGWLKHRATDLERGIRELLDPNSQVNQTGIVAKIYDHPLVNGLYKGTYNHYVRYKNKFGLFRLFIRLFSSSELPSYIPARNFALALMDAVLPANTLPPAAGAAPNNPSGAAGATASPVPTTPSVVLVTRAGVPPAAPAPAPNPLQPLRDAISGVANAQTRRALLALVDAAGGDVSKSRENIENWFNSSMDRVSGWYKRRSQLIILALALAVAVGLNADSIILVQRLSTDKTARDSLVAAAEVYAKANPPGAPSAVPGAATPSKPAPVKPSASPAAKKSPSPAPVSATSPAAAPATQTTTEAAAPAARKPSECEKDEKSAECKLALNLEEIKKLSLPIGWLDSGTDLRLIWPGNKWTDKGGWRDQLYWHWLGWLITALAVSLGAPFWFDLLNKVIVVRSTVKPHEKSPEERSKE